MDEQVISFEEIKNQLIEQSYDETDIAEIEQAFEFAKRLHEGQYRVSEEPYIIHPLQVAYILTTIDLDESTICAALLHDVVEDTNITLDDLKLFFEDNIIEALNLLTHKSNEDYFEYLKKIKTNPLAKAVKLNDLKHNMDITRFENPSERDYERIEKKYKPAVKFLLED